MQCSFWDPVICEIYLKCYLLNYYLVDYGEEKILGKITILFKQDLLKIDWKIYLFVCFLEA